MTTLLASLLGFFTSALPDIFTLYRDSRDRAHELRILELQLQQQRDGFTQRIEEIHTQADIAEARALYKTYRTDIYWVDALNGTVRPVLAYAFFLLYFIVKCMQFALINWDAPLPWEFSALWGVEDQAIFAGIISFYFGQRAMRKVRGQA